MLDLACNASGKISRTWLWSLFFLIALCFAMSSARADCSDRHIKALDKAGRSAADIARLCGMSKDDVLAALEGDDVDTDDSANSPAGGRQGLPGGSQISPCGCWGYVNPGAAARNPTCASGVEHPVACGGFCPAGGLPWARVCM
jgi:hypothetical protein